MKKYTKIVSILSLTASSNVFSDTCVIDESVLSSSNKIHYSLGVNHPSGSISSSRNIISLVAFTLKDGYKSLKRSCQIGSFTNQSDKYRMYYSSDNKPPKGYDPHAIYNNTPYKGFSDGIVYASNGKSTLINLITKDINLNKCWKWASNYSGGNLDRNDNFWTYFCPKQGLVDYIANVVKEKILPIKLETNISPKDSGTISKSPEKTSYSPNEEVTLTATPAKGYKFKQWQGDASGTEATISIKMNGNQNVTAVFEKEEEEKPPIEISSKAVYDSKTNTLSLEDILVPYIDEFTGKEIDNKGIFDAQLQEKTKLVFQLIASSIKFKGIFEGKNTSGYILYDYKTRSVQIPCFEVTTIAKFGNGIEGKAVYYKDVSMKQRNVDDLIFHVEDMTKADSCK